MIINIPEVGRLKPYVRMTQKGKWIEPQAIEYMECKRYLSYQIKNYMNVNKLKMLPEKTPLMIEIEIGVPKSQGHRADVVKLQQAILDASKGLVYKDYNWIDSVSIKREFGHTELFMIVKVVK